LNTLKEELRHNTEKEVSLVVLRDGQNKKLTAKLGEDPTLGFEYENLLNSTHIDYSFTESIPKGTKDAFGKLTEQAKAFKMMATGELDPMKNLGSFFTIGKVYGGTWIWQRFWFITGMLSMVLAFMNLLPIPALDGGHVVFLTYEIISGRPPSDKFLENSQKVGMVILLSLMVFVVGLDFFRTFIK
jgi:regulator of sigma E protease